MVPLRQDICSMCFDFKEFELFPGLGLYSGIFVMYYKLQHPLNKSRTAIIIFYALCVLYILSTVNAVIDLVDITIKMEPVSKNPIRKN